MTRKPASQLDREIAAALARRTTPDDLLGHLATLEARHAEAERELRAAAREADDVTRDDERGYRVDPARRAAAESRWSNAVRAESDLTAQMRVVVIKIRALDPRRVPWRWENTR